MGTLIRILMHINPTFYILIKGLHVVEHFAKILLSKRKNIEEGVGVGVGTLPLSFPPP